jgi:hypothetical protein
MGVTQGRVSAIEHARPGATELRTLAAYVEALGGRLHMCLMPALCTNTYCSLCGAIDSRSGHRGRPAADTLPERLLPMRSEGHRHDRRPSAHWPETGGTNVQRGMPAATAALRSTLPERNCRVIVPRPNDQDGDAGQNGSPVLWAGPGPGRPRVPPSRPGTPSAICPCTAGNSRTHRDTAGHRPAKSNSPRGRENPGHGLFPLVVAGARFELA